MYRQSSEEKRSYLKIIAVMVLLVVGTLAVAFFVWGQGPDGVRRAPKIGVINVKGSIEGLVTCDALSTIWLK